MAKMILEDTCQEKMRGGGTLRKSLRKKQRRIAEDL
jgi:hypothetical protein